jgi:hypothetical protein
VRNIIGSSLGNIRALLAIGEAHYPLFVTLDYSPARITKGLEGASLPHVRATLIEVPLPPDNEDNQEDTVYDKTDN